MPTLYDYLLGRIQNAGFQPADLTLVEYQDAIGDWRGSRDIVAFAAVAQQVQVADIPLERRPRFRFWLEREEWDSGRVFAWDNDAGDFLLVPEDPDPTWTPQVSDLTGA